MDGCHHTFPALAEPAADGLKDVLAKGRQCTLNPCHGLMHALGSAHLEAGPAADGLEDVLMEG